MSDRNSRSNTLMGAVDSANQLAGNVTHFTILLATTKIVIQLALYIASNVMLSNDEERARYSGYVHG